MGAKMITPSRFQSPPRGYPALAIVCGGPPAASTVLSLPSAEYAMKRPSGDQKGMVAPSVSGSGRALREPSGRTQSRRWPEVSLATKARRPPSGEIAMPPKAVLFGAGIEKRTALGRVVGREK